MSRIIYGKRPVIEALRHAPAQITRLVLDRSKQRALDDLVREASRAGISFEWADRREIERLGQTDNHQGAVAVLREFAYTSVKDFLARKADKHRLVVILDQRRRQRLRQLRSVTVQRIGLGTQ